MRKFIELFKAQYSWKNLFNHSRMLGTLLASGLYSVVVAVGVAEAGVSWLWGILITFPISFVGFFLWYEVFKFITLLIVLPLVVLIDNNREDSDLYDEWMKRVKK